MHLVFWEHVFQRGVTKKENLDYMRQETCPLWSSAEPISVQGPRVASAIGDGSQLCLLNWHQLFPSSGFISLAIAFFSTPSGSKISTCGESGVGGGEGRGGETC